MPGPVRRSTAAAAAATACAPVRRSSAPSAAAPAAAPAAAEGRAFARRLLGVLRLRVRGACSGGLRLCLRLRLRGALGRPARFEDLLDGHASPRQARRVAPRQRVRVRRRVRGAGRVLILRDARALFVLAALFVACEKVVSDWSGIVLRTPLGGPRKETDGVYAARCGSGPSDAPSCPRSSASPRATRTAHPPTCPTSGDRMRVARGQA